RGPAGFRRNAGWPVHPNVRRGGHCTIVVSSRQAPLIRQHRGGRRIAADRRSSINVVEVRDEGQLGFAAFAWCLPNAPRSGGIERSRVQPPRTQPGETGQEDKNSAE